MSPPLPRLIQRLLFEGHQRSIRTKQNIVALFVLRGISSLVNLLLVPMTLAYLNQTRYGIWITLSSIINWVSMMDIGLGNGLRNEFARALALNDRDLARVQISTTYAFVGGIVAVLSLAFLAVNPFLPWSRILDAPADMGAELGVLAASVFIFFCLRLLFGLISTILIADQKPAISTFLEVVTSVLSLGAVYLLTRTVAGSLYWLGILISGITAAVPLAANFWFFGGRYRAFTPSFRFVHLARGRQLITLGVQFFALQLAGVVIFASSNLVITQIFGPGEVVPYNIAFKYYGLASLAFTMLLTPFWSAYTDAYTGGDTQWIAMTIRKLRRAWWLLALVLVAMTLVADRVYALWVGDSVHVPLLLSVFMGAYVLIVAWSTIFSYFINGTGKIRLQLCVAGAIALAIIPFAVLLATRFALGSAGVILATCLCLLPGCILWPIQARRILNGTATGLWAR